MAGFPGVGSAGPVPNHIVTAVCAASVSPLVLVRSTRIAAGWSGWRSVLRAATPGPAGPAEPPWSASAAPIAVSSARPARNMVGVSDIDMAGQDSVAACLT